MIQQIDIPDEKKRGLLWDHCQDSIGFRVIPFEKDQVHIHLLMQFITLIRHQLPNMLEKDVFQAIFATSSENCLLCDQNHIIGGICYKKIHQYKVAQIIFMVVAEKHQRQGKGSLLMNNFKNYLAKRALSVIGTHADNNSIGFYEKHGFAEIQYIANRHFQGNISYKNSTLLQAKVRSNIDYLRMPKCLQNQKTYIENMLNEQVISRNKDQGRYLWSNHKSYLEMQRYVGINQNIKIMNPLKAYSQLFNSNTTFFTSKKVLNHSIKSYIDRLQAIMTPELLQLNPKYQKIQIIQYRLPICLQNIKEKIKEGQYKSIRQFKVDLSGMIENCLQFYREQAGVVLNLYEVRAVLQEIV